MQNVEMEIQMCSCPNILLNHNEKSRAKEINCVRLETTYTVEFSFSGDERGTKVELAGSSNFMP